VGKVETKMLVLIVLLLFWYLFVQGVRSIEEETRQRLMGLDTFRARVGPSINPDRVVRLFLALSPTGCDAIKNEADFLDTEKHWFHGQRVGA
jgi:hypothetical protein